MTWADGSNIRINCIRQHYLRSRGSGHSVVIVPGIVSPAMLWSHVGEWLSEQYDCFILDVRGRGLSESGAHLDYGVDACAGDLVAFVKAIGMNAPIVIGHSMGARIALRGAATWPGLFGGVVLVDPPTSGPGRRPYPVPKARTLRLLRAAKRGESLANQTPSGAKSWPTALQQLRDEWLASCDERAVHVAYDDFHDTDIFVDLAKIEEPVSLLCATHGDVVSDADIAEMRHVGREISIERLAGVGHQMQAEDFATFQTALGKILLRHCQTLKSDPK